MKHSNTNSILATIILIGVTLVLLIPNVALDITEVYTPLQRAVNVLLPAGVYVLLLSAWRRNAITGLWLIPVMILCAFQIVLLFLYGESIIAIDMFLNVATTNSHEAGELLKNLTGAIITVCIIYLPAIVLCIVGASRKARLGDTERKYGLAAGAVLSVAGLVCLACSYGTDSSYMASRKLFPLNVCHNMVVAVERTELSNEYLADSDGFRYNAVEASSDSLPEVFVLVIGETSRADNWQLNGYGRETTPRLAQRRNLVSFTKALSESNTTHKSVPLLLSHLSCDKFGDSIYCTRSVIDAFGEAGFNTAWISNQQHNGSLIDFFGGRADRVKFLCDDGSEHHDLELCGELKNALDVPGKDFVVLHTYGSHFNYTERYPEDYARFGSHINTEASKENRKCLMDAYDNSILYTDAVLDSIMSTLEQCGRPAALVYLSDHGEDIFDDDRERFLHASPTPTFYQIHVPMLVWVSDSYRRVHPEKYETARANADRNVSSSRSAFHTLLSLAEISAPCYRPEAALTENSYTEPVRMYLNDYNEGVALADAGLRKPDYDRLAQHRISQK